MDVVTLCLFLLLAVVISGVVARLSPIALPLPIVQIALGAAITSVVHLGVELKPDVFFGLFLPPLLFLDGWRIPKDGLLRDAGSILALAFGLVLFTVLGLGLLIAWLISPMPMAVAFALASVLSPTDVAAVSAIAARVPMPKRLRHILEGESLLNDASGLICMRFAVAAAATGAFSPSQAAVDLLWLVTGGTLVGFVVTRAVVAAKGWLARRYGEETGSEILISLLIPFGAYLLAERLHASGILAAVAAGVTMSRLEQSGRVHAVTRLRRGVVLETVQFAANGVVFILLGEQLPRIVAGARLAAQQAGYTDPVWLVGYIFGISVALAALRCLWVVLSLRLIMFRAARAGHRVETPDRRLLAAATLSGVRGAVTLAGVLSLPLAMTDGSPFPMRDLVILLAAGVIIVSLLAANLTLPRLLDGQSAAHDPIHKDQEDRARIAAARAAIAAIERHRNHVDQSNAKPGLYADLTDHLNGLYKKRVDGHPPTGARSDGLPNIEHVERDLRLIGLRAERDELYRLGRSRELSDEIVRVLVREVDLLEARFTAS